MAKQWFDFSASVRGSVDSKSRIALAAIGLSFAIPLLAVSQPCQAAPHRLKLKSRAKAPLIAPSPTPPPLPAYDLNYVAPPSQKITVGDTIDIRVNSLSQFGSDLTLEPEAGSQPLNELGFELLKEGDHYRAVIMKAGHIVLPKLVIHGPGGKAIGVTNPLALDVASAISPDDAKPNEPVPMKPPVSLAFPLWAAILMGLALAAAVGLLIWGMYRWYRKRKLARLAAAQKPLPPRPEDELALEQIDALAREGWMEKGKHKIHYFKLSEILKRYLGSRYGIDAPESTSDELLALLDQTHQVSDEVHDRIQRLFVLLDRVKFTDYQPELAEGSSVIEDSRKLVQMTRKWSEGSKRAL